MLKKKIRNIMLAGIMILSASPANAKESSYTKGAKAIYDVSSNSDAKRIMPGAIDMEATDITFISNQKLYPNTMLDNLSYDKFFNIKNYTYTHTTETDYNYEKHTVRYVISYRMSPSQKRAAENTAKKAVQKMRIDKKSKISDKEKAWKIVSYLAKKTSYKKGKFTPYDCLVKNKAVCEGYALSFDMMAKYAGLKSYPATGTLHGENHMWNLVRINKKYYVIDPTRCDAGKKADRLGFMKKIPGLKYDEQTRKMMRRYKIMLHAGR